MAFAIDKIDFSHLTLNTGHRDIVIVDSRTIYLKKIIFKKLRRTIKMQPKPLSAAFVNCLIDLKNFETGFAT